MPNPIVRTLTFNGVTYDLQDNVSGYTTNTGTVTSVGITNGGGLSVSGSPITTNGSITVGHSNSVAAQTTQGLYPIKIDANGHISAYGSEITSLPASDVYDWAKASIKPSYTFSEIGSKPTTISGYGITDAYTKTEVDNKVSAVLRYKGVKAAVSNLPTTGNVTGDVWHVTATSGEYAWDGTEWQELGTAVDLSNYITTDDSRLSDARTPLVHNQALSTITGADDLQAIEVLTGTSGFLKKTAANTWALDTNTYLTDETIFKGSAAYNITSTDISNWNGKSSTDEKVKAIALTFDDIEYYPIFGDSSGIAKTKNYTTAFGIGCSSTYNRIDLKLGTASIAGQITLYRGQDSNRYATIKTNTITGGRIITIPDKTGTIALTSDIPSVYSSSNTNGYLTMATLPIYNGTVV